MEEDLEAKIAEIDLRNAELTEQYRMEVCVSKQILLLKPMRENRTKKRELEFLIMKK